LFKTVRHIIKIRHTEATNIYS